MLNSHQYITPILAALLTAEHRRLEGVVATLHRDNKLAWGKTGDGFVYGGEFFVPKGTPIGKRVILPLHERMEPEVKDHLADRKIIEDDSASIHQLLFKLIEPCFCAADLRDAIPDCILEFMPSTVKELERCRQPTFFLNHPRDFKLYERVLPRIQFYSAARLLY